MDGKKDAKIPEKPEKSFPWRGFVLWPFVIMLIYLLSFGPVKKLCNAHYPAGWFGHAIETIYVPWYWVYDHTPLHKPLGSYMHFWAPQDFDKYGTEAS